jgi:hypothetical protein
LPESANAPPVPLRRTIVRRSNYAIASPNLVAVQRAFPAPSGARLPTARASIKPWLRGHSQWPRFDRQSAGFASLPQVAATVRFLITERAVSRSAGIGSSCAFPDLRADDFGQVSGGWRSGTRSRSCRTIFRSASFSRFGNRLSWYCSGCEPGPFPVL